MLANFPNPFNPETWILFELTVDAGVSISIYDVTGRRIVMCRLNARLTGMTKQKRVRMYHQVPTSINRIVAASRDTTTKVWDAQTGQELVTLTGHDSRCIESEWKRITINC